MSHWFSHWIHSVDKMYVFKLEINFWLNYLYFDKRNIVLVHTDKANDVYLFRREISRTNSNKFIVGTNWKKNLVFFSLYFKVFILMRNYLADTYFKVIEITVPTWNIYCLCDSKTEIFTVNKDKYSLSDIWHCFRIWNCLNF